MAIHNSFGNDFPSFKKPDFKMWEDDLIYFGYACLLHAKVLFSSPLLIADKKSIQNRLESGMDFDRVVEVLEGRVGVVQKSQRRQYLAEHFKRIKEDLGSILLINERRRIFFVREAVLGFKTYNPALVPFKFYFPLYFNEMWNVDSICKWLRRFGIYLCVTKEFDACKQYLNGIYQQIGKEFSALRRIEEEQLDGLWVTLENTCKGTNVIGGRNLLPPNRDRRMNCQDQLSCIQAWLDVQSQDNRNFIQQKLQLSINQLVHRKKKKLAGKKPLNSYLTQQTYKQFEDFRLERGLNKENALEYLICEGIKVSK